MGDAVTRRRVPVWLRRSLFAAPVLVAAFLTFVPIGRYLARAAYEEGKILARRQSIAAIISDSTTEPTLRAKLQLVLDARRFAIDSLGLKAQQEFTTFSRLDRDTLVLVLSAAYRDSLAFRTWWFPVVGSVPYAQKCAPLLRGFSGEACSSRYWPTDFGHSRFPTDMSTWRSSGCWPARWSHSIP